MDAPTDTRTGLTYATAIAHAIAVLRDRSDAPRLEGELLVAHATAASRSMLFAAPATPLFPEQAAAFESLLRRRQRGEPLAYVVGTQDFWTLTLAVTPAVLIPRPETELVVERVLALLPHDETNVLDVATGSGAIALAIASERPEARVTGTDISTAALDVARGNAASLGLARVRFLEGSWLEPVAGERFDVIASNPPYIAADDPDLAADVREYEPGLALIAGSTGLECLHRLVREAPAHLLPGGWLVLEHGWKQGPAVRELLESAGFGHVRSHADLAGHERVTEGRRE